MDLCACLISSDVSLVMLRGSESRTFTEMSSGRCWTMSESKERFEHCTKKNSFPFQFCVIPLSSTTEPFFLLFFPLLIAACRIPCSVFLSPCVLVLSLRPVCLPSCVSISSPIRFGFSALSLIFIPSSSSLSAFLCDETGTWFLKRQRVVTDTATKLWIKSMFNSDDCGPIGRKSGSLLSIKGWRKKGSKETTDKNNGIVICCIFSAEKKPSTPCCTSAEPACVCEYADELSFNLLLHMKQSAVVPRWHRFLFFLFWVFLFFNQEGQQKPEPKGCSSMNKVKCRKMLKHACRAEEQGQSEAHTSDCF